MSAKRDSLFPPASIGRAQGATIVRTPSRETLAVHPLLSTGPASPSNSTLDSSPNAKYVPYTPRQRPTTTGAPAQPVTSSSPGGAPGKPQLVNLRAAAQNVGIEANSIGWAILEKISYEGDSSDDWSEIWNLLTKGKAALLLPAESSSGQESITPDFVRDHVILYDLASRENTAVVTLSGLRGQLNNDCLTFRSTLHRSTKSFQALLAPSVSRAVSLDALPPLPAYPPESSYPSFKVLGFSAALPFPSRATKPPLPPRPGVRSASTPSSARLPLPFASLFGQRPTTPPPQLPPTTTTTASSSADTESTIDVSVFVIDAVLSKTDIATGIIGALKGEIAIALNDHPPWLVERVHTFALPYFPFVRVPVGKKKLQDIGGNPNRVVYAINGVFDKPEELADKFQAFYRAVEREWGNGGHVRDEEGMQGGELDVNDLQDPESIRGEAVEAEEAPVRDALETIESTLCVLLYDRLFLPSTSDDASHNEALSSRIAALNMLDLGLEHLDLDIGNANHTEVDTVVRTCGQTLAHLDLTARSPAEKAAVLVSAHKIVVEGLSKIPPIRLKSQGCDSKASSGHDDAPERVNKAPTVTVASGHVPLSLEPTEKQSSLKSGVPTSRSPDRPSVIKPPSPEAVHPSASSPVSGDVLLPMLIFSVVKANPSRLVSHLLFTQRFRNQSFGGEESYCLINLMAVAEFLENVDLGALGLGESERKALSTSDLTPIPIARPNLPESQIATVLSSEGLPASLRGRVEQGVDAIAGSANKVILGVVDSSFGVLRAFLPGQTTHRGNGSGTSVGSGSAHGMGETDTAILGARPGLGLTRRETGFSIAGLTVTLPGGPGRARSQSHVEEGQRELVEVSSRPASLRSPRSGYEGEESEDIEGSSDEGGSVQEEQENEGVGVGMEEREGGDAEVEGEEEDEDEEEDEEGDEEEVHDTRSIKSFESMLSSRQTKGRATTNAAPLSASTSTPTRRRKRLSDLTDRLTQGMAGMSRRAQGGDAHKALIPSGRLPPPNRRFVECTEQDIRVSEVGELLREYQRLVEAVRSAGGFQE